MHFSSTRWNHIFQNPKFLIHLRSSSTLNQTMCRLPSNLSSSNTRRRRLFLFGSRNRFSSRRYFRGIVHLVCFLFGLSSRFHLNYLSRSRRWWRKSKSTLAWDLSSRRSSSNLDYLAGRNCRRRWGARVIRGSR